MINTIDSALSSSSVPPSKRPHMRFVPTQEQRDVVKVLAATKVPFPIIATLVHNPETKKGISKTTLKREFKDELKNGKALVGAFVINKLFSLIAKGHPASIFFYLKCQEGWRERGPIDEDYDPEDTGSRLPLLPGLLPPGGNVIDITPEQIPDDPSLASQIYQRMIAG